MDTSKNPIKDLNEFVAKVDNMKKKDKLDLSSDQDLTVAIMNLVGIEEHFFFTAEKTGKKQYYDFLYEIREIRKELLKKIVIDSEGEVWCISKHLLAASYRLMEVGTKQLTMNSKEEAYNLFNKAFKLYSLFWGLNMHIMDAGDIKNIDGEKAASTGSTAIKTDNIKKIDANAINKHDEDPQGFMGKLGALVKKAINCCIE